MSISFVAISGDIQNLIGTEVTNFVLKAAPLKSYFDGSILVAGPSVKFKAVSGSVTGSIAETETTQQHVAFSANYTGDGIYQEILFQSVIIPNVPFLDLVDFLTPIVNS